MLLGLDQPGSGEVRIHQVLRVVDPLLAAETLTTGESPLAERETEVLRAAGKGELWPASRRPPS